MRTILFLLFSSLLAVAHLEIKPGMKIEITMANGKSYSGPVTKQKQGNGIGITLCDPVLFWHFLPFAKMRPVDQALFDYDPAKLSPEKLRADEQVADAIQKKWDAYNALLDRGVAEERKDNELRARAVPLMGEAKQVIAKGTIVKIGQEPNDEWVLIEGYKAKSLDDQVEVEGALDGTFTYTTQLGFQLTISKYICAGPIPQEHEKDILGRDKYPYPNSR